MLIVSNDKALRILYEIMFTAAVLPSTAPLVCELDSRLNYVNMYTLVGSGERKISNISDVLQIKYNRIKM